MVKILKRSEKWRPLWSGSRLSWEILRFDIVSNPASIEITSLLVRRLGLFLDTILQAVIELAKPWCSLQSRLASTLLLLLYDHQLFGWVQGIVYVQYKQSFDMPVISHMEEGVKAGDLSALRNRVSNDTSLRPRGVRHNSEVIDVSP